MVNDEKKKPPVVFIHGWKASILADKYTNEEKNNYSLTQLLGVGEDQFLSLPFKWEDGNQVKDNLVATKPIYKVSCFCGVITLAEVYGPLLNRISEIRDLHVFAYDWRRCLDETCMLFEIFLENNFKSTGQRPQVIAHSMGGLITLSVLNKRPDLFHSVLFGSPAFSPSITVLRDLSLVGVENLLGLNKTMMTPLINLSNPAPYFFLAGVGEREKVYSKPNTDLVMDKNDKPVVVDLHKLETYRMLKIGIYHPKSGVKEVTKEMEDWMESVLSKCLAFRKTLVPPENAGVNYYPPVGVLRANHQPTRFAFSLSDDGTMDLENNSKYLPGDGRVVLEDMIPPKGIPCCKIVDNNLDHTNVLNDLKNVEDLLTFLIQEKKKKA